MIAHRLSMRLLVIIVSSLPCYSAAISAEASLFTGPGGTITQPGTISFADFGPFGGFNATATVDFGAFSLEANANCGFTTVCGASAGASFSDSITILDKGGILQASPGLSNTPLGEITDGWFSFGSFHGILKGPQYFGDGCPGCLFQHTVSAGQALAFSGGGGVIAQDLFPEDPNQGSETDLVWERFSFTMLDANGQAISGFHYTSDSGHDYGLTGGIFVAPEPTAIGCAIGGLVALMLLGANRIRLFLSARVQ
jgi:hypothetical protein